MGKITNSDEAWNWIVENRKKLSRESLISALDKWGIIAGFTKMVGEDFLWCIENIEPKNCWNKK